MVFLFWIVKSNGTSVTDEGDLDGFAQCLTDKGAIFYGAFWCPHCASQKALFGNSIKLVNYVECSTPDGNGQLQICKDKSITNYPTWDLLPYGDATTTTRLTGEISLDELSSKTGCALPSLKY